MNKPAITFASLSSRFDYSKNSGELRWKECLRFRKSDTIGRAITSRDAGGYIQVNVFGKVMKAHRIAWMLTFGEWPDGHIDHINGDRADNRICNLRVVSNAINCQNKRSPLPTNKSGFLGVSWNKGAWRATIQLNKKQYSLGRFNSPELAHAAYLDAKRKIHSGCTI